MEILTLVIARYAAVVATFAAIAQVITWRHSGARVEVSTNYGFLVQGPHMGDQHVLVTATNKGRAPVALISWGFEVANGRSLVILRPMPQSTPLPHTLEGGHEANFFVALHDFEDSMREHGDTSAQAFVRLGTGKRVLSRKRLTAA